MKNNRIFQNATILVSIILSIVELDIQSHDNFHLNLMSTAIGAPISSSAKLKSYYQLVVAENGNTSIVKRDYSNTETIGYSNVPQIIKSLSPNIATPKGVVFTQMFSDNPWHHCPSPQIVVCLDGAWFIKTTDNVTTVLKAGDVLYQDNTPNHPASKKGTRNAMHFSGVADGYESCDQIIVQLEQPTGSIANSLMAKPPL